MLDSVLQTSSGRERAFFILQRWIDIVAYALAGSAFFAYAGSSLGSLGTATLLQLTSDNSTAAVYLSLLAAAAALWLCHKLIGARLQHIRWAVFFPPLPVAVILSCAASPLWPTLRDEQHATAPLATSDVLVAGAGYGAFWVIQLLLTELGTSVHLAFFARERKPDWQGKTIDELTDDELTDWLRSESPVDDERRDLFSAAGIVERLLQRLSSGRNSIALQGPYGAGKSSIIRMAERRAAAEKQPLWFVRVSCWGFDNSALVQREVLNQVTQQFGEHVDCFSIRGLPQNYLDAVSKDIGWLGMFGVFVNRRLSPLQELQRLSPVLRSVGRDVVVVIEDVDRHGRNFDLSDIQALLARFREVDGVSFVLTIADEQQVDFELRRLPIVNRGGMRRA
ncbi:MAG TPA: P-loop NTPase fold protein [Chthoniobacterales bacterium]|nr:P-loop NTPase fold protein [Chthoniobacterales bacterium]